MGRRCVGSVVQRVQGVLQERDQCGVGASPRPGQPTAICQGGPREQIGPSRDLGARCGRPQRRLRGYRVARAAACLAESHEELALTSLVRGVRGTEDLEGLSRVASGLLVCELAGRPVAREDGVVDRLVRRPSSGRDVVVRELGDVRTGAGAVDGLETVWTCRCSRNDGVG